MDMGLERLIRGPFLLLVRVGLVLSAVGLCAHVYLQVMHWGDPTVALKTQEGRNGSRTKQGSAGAPEDRGVRGRISYVRTLKKERKTKDVHPALLRQRKSPRWHIDMEPWASERRSLEDEARRFLKYITTPQVPCVSEGDGAKLTDAEGAWAVCLDPQYSLIHSIEGKHCRVYSFGGGVTSLSACSFKICCLLRKCNLPSEVSGGRRLHLVT